MKYLLTGEESERLEFRLLDNTYYNDWLPLFVDKDTAIFLGMGHLSTAKEQCDLWFEKCLARYDNDTGGMNVLIDKSTGEMVGQCGLLIQEIEGASIMEIGYSVLPEYCGKGYASEAAQKCRDHAFLHRFTDALHSVIYIENYGSINVAERNGMKIWKHLPDYRGVPVDIYRVTFDEWQQNK